MFVRILNLFLAALVALCPVVCQLSRGAQSSAASGSCCCCQHKCEATPDSAGTRLGPRKSANTSGNQHDTPCPSCAPCLCKGGIVVEPTRLAIDVSWVAMCEPAVEVAGLPSHAGSQRLVVHVAESPGGENIGRRMRCLHNSLIC